LYVCHAAAVSPARSSAVSTMPKLILSGGQPRSSPHISMSSANALSGFPSLQWPFRSAL